jgi:acyl-CoA thioesterase II
MEELLDIKAIDRDIFIGRNLHHFKGARGAFGGHIVSHAMKVALTTIDDESLVINSIHSLFIKPVKPDKVVYYVDSRKDGKKFSFRSVQAIQDGKVVFQCMVSFSRPQERPDDLSHIMTPMPSVPPPDHELSVAFHDDLDFIWNPIEYRVVMPPGWKTLMEQSPLPSCEPKHEIWVRSKETLACENHNRILLGYMSDFFTLSGIRKKYPNHHFDLLTSLDHTLWFHDTVDIFQWHLLETQCQQIGHGLSLLSIRVFTEKGNLVASGVQQGVYKAKL